MVSFRQLFYKKVIRFRKKHTKRNALLRGCPQKRGFCVKIDTENPKKPNSAKRRVARVFIYSLKRKIRVQIPGEGKDGMKKFGKVLIRGGHTRDLPGIRYRVVRGKFDCHPVWKRRKARSKYGVKRIIASGKFDKYIAEGKSELISV